MKSAFDKIAEGLGDAIAIKEGRADPATYRVHAPDQVDVKAIRKAQGLSQEAFAKRYGLSKATIEQWEQGRRAPDTGSRLLLRVIEREPEAIHRSLAG